MSEPKESPPGQSAATWTHRLAWIGVALALGAVTGILAKLADVSGGWELGILTSNMAVWTLGVSLWGALAPRWFDAIGRSVAFTLAMNLGYYAWAQVVLGYPEAPISKVWIELSVTAVSAVALLVHWAVRSPRWWAGAGLAIVGAIPLTDEPVTHAWYAITGEVPGISQAPLAASISVLTWALVLFVLPRHHSTRLWSLALALPAYLTVAELYPALWSVLLGF